MIKIDLPKLSPAARILGTIGIGRQAGIVRSVGLARKAIAVSGIGEASRKAVELAAQAERELLRSGLAQSDQRDFLFDIVRAQAQLLREIGEHAEAVTKFLEAWSLAPKLDLDQLTYVTSALDQREDSSEAAFQMFLSLLEVDSKSARFPFFMSICKIDETVPAAELATRVERNKRVADASSSLGWPFYYLGIASMRSHKFQGAVDLFDRARKRGCS